MRKYSIEPDTLASMDGELVIFGHRRQAMPAEAVRQDPSNYFHPDGQYHTWYEVLGGEEGTSFLGVIDELKVRRVRQERTAFGARALYTLSRADLRPMSDLDMGECDPSSPTLG